MRGKFNDPFKDNVKCVSVAAIIVNAIASPIFWIGKPCRSLFLLTNKIVAHQNDPYFVNKNDPYFVKKQINK